MSFKTSLYRTMKKKTIDKEELTENILKFERVENVAEVLILGEDGGIRRIIYLERV